MTDDEVDSLVSGCEDAQGQVNYEGRYHDPQFLNVIFCH